MINPNDFIFHSDFNYLPTKESGETTMPAVAGPQEASGIFLVKSGVEGTPFISMAGIYNETGYEGAKGETIYYGQPTYMPPAIPILRNGKLYAKYGAFYQKIRWKIHAN